MASPSETAFSPPGRREIAIAAALSVAWVAVFAWPWLRDSARAFPDAASVSRFWGADARLILWVLDWDLHALFTDPARLFDPPIFHPLRGALTGSEHFLASALLAAPVALATGNLVLAANLVVLGTYSLAMLAAYVLCRGYGLEVIAAAVAGMAFGFGALRLPGDLHVLQYPNFALALVAIATGMVAARPGARRSAGLFAATLLALLSSYYLAAMTVLLLAVEFSLALVRRGPAVAARIASAAVPAGLVLVAVSVPYLERAGEAVAAASSGVGDSPAQALGRIWVRLWFFRNEVVRMPVIALVVLGLSSPLLRRCRPSERWWRWTALAAASFTVALGPVLIVGSWAIPLPAALLARTPLAHLYSIERFVVLLELGWVGLAAEGTSFLLGVVRDRAPRASRWLVPVIGVALVLWTGVPRALDVAGQPRTVLADAGSRSPTDRWLATHASGPLLEIPGPVSVTPGNLFVQSEAMLAATFHRLPLVNGHTGRRPPGLSVMEQEIANLPDPDSVRALVDLTGVRWILVRKGRLRPVATGRWENLPKKLASVVRIAEVAPDILLRVDLAPRRDWAGRLASGSRLPGQTDLGTPISPLPPSSVSGRVEVWPPARRAVAGAPVSAILTVRNDGDADWPVRAPGATSEEGLVVLVATWRRSGQIGSLPAPTTVRLYRDVATGDRLRWPVQVAAPSTPGSYVLDFALVQLGSGPLPGIAPASVSVEVRGPAPAP